MHSANVRSPLSTVRLSVVCCRLRVAQRCIAYVRQLNEYPNLNCGESQHNKSKCAQLGPVNDCTVWPDTFAPWSLSLAVAVLVLSACVHNKFVKYPKNRTMISATIYHPTGPWHTSVRRGSLIAISKCAKLCQGLYRTRPLPFSPFSLSVLSATFPWQINKHIRKEKENFGPLRQALVSTFTVRNTHKHTHALVAIFSIDLREQLTTELCRAV